MKKVIFLTILLMTGLGCVAQGVNNKRKVRKLLREGQYHLDGEDYPRSWRAFKQALALDPRNGAAAVNAAFSSDKLGYPQDSIFFLKSPLTSSKLPDAKYYLARILHQEKKFDEALALLAAYKETEKSKRLQDDSEIGYRSGISLNAKNFTTYPHRSVVRNMGPNINSKFPDYVPLIIADESALYFTSKREGSSNNQKNGDNYYFEDVFVSKQVDGKWQPAENVGEPINSATNDACVALSADGQKMIVYRTAENVETGDLYQTVLGLNNKWEPLQLLGPEINSEFTESSASFSNDSTEIFFSSNRPGGFGGKDIYRIRRLPNGKWSLPFNLGAGVNTKYDDDAPFSHPDGVTIYFSSKGHNTMGEYDVFKSMWDKEKNQFSIAENLGYPINDVQNDIFFALSVDGQRAYYSTVKEQGFGGMDIYEVDTRFGDNDLKVKTGYSYIEDIAARVKISLVDNDTRELFGSYLSNPTTGRFIMIINPLKSYSATIEAEGCKTMNVQINPEPFEKTDKQIEFRLKKQDAQ
jgi:tetratricopeptide (TPR) repeat protein